MNFLSVRHLPRTKATIKNCRYFLLHGPDCLFKKDADSKNVMVSVLCLPHRDLPEKARQLDKLYLQKNWIFLTVEYGQRLSPLLVDPCYSILSIVHTFVFVVYAFVFVVTLANKCSNSLYNLHIQCRFDAYLVEKVLPTCTYPPEKRRPGYGKQGIISYRSYLPTDKTSQLGSGSDTESMF